MALRVINKLTNYLMPMESVAKKEETVVDHERIYGRKPVNLQVHSNQASPLKIVIVSKPKPADVRTYANYLKANIAVIINLVEVDSRAQQTIKDFMNGACYVFGGNVQRVADYVVMYTPQHVEIDKQLLGFSVPTYVKPRME